MSVQDQTILDLQNRLHQENQRRMDEQDKRLERMEKTLGDIVANTVDLPEIKKRVDDHHETINKLKGASALGIVLFGGVDFIIHILTKKM
jgi:hypothetical protein